MQNSVLGPLSSPTGRTLPWHRHHRRKFKGHAASPSPSTNPGNDLVSNLFCPLLHFLTLYRLVICVPENY